MNLIYTVSTAIEINFTLHAEKTLGDLQRVCTSHNNGVLTEVLYV